MASKKTDVPPSDGDRLSELELTLTILWNSVGRWISQHSPSANGLSELDVFLLHLLVYRNKKLRGADLAFVLAIDDAHLVSYALKKLTKLEFTTSERIGKEVFYQATKKGKDHYQEFHETRRRYLEPSMRLILQGADIEALTASLRALSGAYEQAARAAASAKGS